MQDTFYNLIVINYSMEPFCRISSLSWHWLLYVSDRSYVTR